MAKKEGTCAVGRCRQWGVLIYHDKDVCEKHWDMHCDDERPFDLRDKWKIPHEHIRVPVEKEKENVPDRTKEERGRGVVLEPQGPEWENLSHFRDVCQQTYSRDQEAG